MIYKLSKNEIDTIFGSNSICYCFDNNSGWIWFDIISLVCLEECIRRCCIDKNGEIKPRASWEWKEDGQEAAAKKGKCLNVKTIKIPKTITTIKKYFTTTYS